ncbi:MAG: protein kinase domain-containing protein [Blastocatellia bacterium]
MNAAQSPRIEELFHAALERDTSSRTEFLSEACGDNRILREEVEALLEALQESPEFVVADHPLTAFDAQIPPQVAPQAGARIGPYRLVREIGYGGMGAVWLAERDDARFQKQVAIKLIRAGLVEAGDANGAARRFREERQILARLEHPSIARLIDGGETADGSPWLALEFVEGERIDQYCQRRSLSLNERLELFRKVCDAVHYAHQNLVVHRDLKPANILITKDGAPRLLDFGIARLLDAEGAMRDVTLTYQRMLTLDYASPEQVRGKQITTTSDVYSLGVVLYELLSGKRPYDLSEKSLTDAVHIIGEVESPPPSQAVESEKLRRQLAGDLDNIVMMALRKEPARRYASVEQMSRDIQRHLEGLPVTASPATWSYRGRKFVRRNKGVVVAAALITLLLLIAGIAVAWQARIARRQRDQAQGINNFFRKMLSIADPTAGTPGHGKGAEITFVEAIRVAEKWIDVDFKDQPEIRNDLHHTLGQTWFQRGEFNAAEPHLRAARELTIQLHGEHHPRAIQNLYKLGLITGNRGDNPAAVGMIRQSVEMMRLQEPENGALPYMLLDLGSRLGFLERAEEAEPLILEAREIFRKRAGNEENVQVASISCALGKIQLEKGELERAEAHYHECLARFRRLPDIKHETGGALFHLGVIDYIKGNLTDAEISLTEAEGLFSRYLGASYPQIADFLYYLASIHYVRKDYARAEAEARRALDIVRRHHTPDNPRTIIALALLGKVLVSKGQPKLAAPHLNEAMEKLQTKSQRTSGYLARATGTLGECLILLKRYEEAERLLNGAYSGLQSTCNEKCPDLIEVRGRLRKLYEAWGKPEQAARFRQ